MKPLLLELHAFGPFAASERVDFTALGVHRFFLIHGPTGAGKTTLLDAMCFGLYGDSSGGERDPRAMRSDHASPSVATRVVFEFSLGARRFRIERMPAQERPKLRGSGTVLAKAEAQLDEWIDGAFTSLESQPNKVKARCELLLGFSSEQFRQVVVLPQGRFREVLTATHEKRGPILEQLFSTGLYQRIEDALRLDAGTIRLETRELLAQKKTLYALAEVEDDAQLEQRRSSIHTELERAETHAAEARHEEAAARLGLRQAEEASTLLAELGEAALSRDLSETEARGLEDSRATIALGRRAQRVRPADATRRVADVAFSAADARAKSSQTAATAAEQRAAVALHVLTVETARAPEREGAEVRLRFLGDLGEKVKAAAAVQRELTALSAQLAPAVREQLVEVLTRRATLVEETRAARDTARAAAARLDAFALQRGSARERERRASELAFARVELHQTEESLGNLEAAAEVAARVSEKSTQQLLALEQAHRAGQAARLSVSLRRGEACPVCGSAAHPRPAQAELGLVTDEALERAQAGARGAEAELTRAGRALQTLREKVAGDRARVEQRILELASGPTQALALPALEAAVTAAEKAVTRAKQLDAALAQQLGDVEATRAELAVLDGRLAQQGLERSRLDGELHALLAPVPEALRELEAVRAAFVEARNARDEQVRVFELAREADSVAGRDVAASRAQHLVEAATTRRLAMALDESRTELAEALVAAEFSDESAYLAAWLEPDALEAVERRVAEHDLRRAAAHDRFARATAAARNVVTLDVPAARARVELATSAVERTLTERQAARGSLDAIARVTDGLSALSARAVEAEARYALVGRLAEVANGDNASNLKFHSFVLGVLLDEVLASASVRLQTMTSGRFELQRSTRVDDRRTSSGLDIDVLDHHTGTSRPGNTLSGGEGFLASLALALGLADVVQARAGGIHLETLFVDEGFGSLDPESLNLAINTLVELQHSGRMVGIISHVAELTERIDVRLEVKSTGHGSRIELHLP